MAAEESYPDELRYHPEHDWARVDGDEATLGITWYAQNALGDIVHFESPEVGITIAQGESYGEVESVKAVSDVIAPLGRDPRGQREGCRGSRDHQRGALRRGLAHPRPPLGCRRAR